jgi:DNA-binding response OmpR family regulator
MSQRYTRHLEKPRVLIVDGDRRVRDTFALLLAEKGYLVDVAGDGEEAIQKVDVNWYNLALIDHRLPDMAGTKLLTLFRETVPRMMKVILTDAPMLDKVIEAINRGVDGYLTKPVTPDKLFTIVNRLLDRQGKDHVLTDQSISEFVNSRLKLGRTIRREKEVRATSS